MTGERIGSRQAIFVPAFAKINLTLRVLGRRPDGYHGLLSVFQTVSLHDTLRLQPTSDGVIACATSLPTLNTPDNLVERAARLARDRAGTPSLGAHIEVEKSIPSQSGLGGGSSDAATTLAALNALWELGRSPRELEELGAELGSDVPFFTLGGTALITGRGEFVRPLPDAEALWYLLAKPPLAVSTPTVFRALTPADYTGEGVRDPVAEAIERGDPLPLEALTNTLEGPVLRTYPAVAQTRESLLAAGAPLVRMSGSGPTLYAPFRDLGEAVAVRDRAQAVGLAVWLASSVSRAVVAGSRPAGWDADADLTSSEQPPEAP